MQFHTVASRSLASLALIVLAARPVHGQRLEDGERELQEKAYKLRLLCADLFKGTATAVAKEKAHQEAADIAAKEVTYPLYWSTIGNQQPPVGKMSRQVVEFESRLFQMTKFKSSTEIFQQMYCRQVVEHAVEVILRGKPIAGVSAARMLVAIPERRLERGILQSDASWMSDVGPRLAEGNAEYLAEVLLSTLDNPKVNDGAKYYLLRTLASLLGLPRQTPPLVKKETEDKAILTAMKMVEKKTVFPRAALRGEVEGYKVLRREAIKVVAQSRLPVLGDKERPALTLAKVAGNDQGLTPPPRLDERIEAVVGLARMASAAAKSPDLQPDYAALQIARCVFSFGLAAEAEREVPKAARSRPWKVDAARLIEALDGLKATVKDPYAQEAVKRSLDVLAPIEKGSQAQAPDLGDWLSRNEPPGKSLFKGGADSTVKPAAEKEK